MTKTKPNKIITYLIFSCMVILTAIFGVAKADEDNTPSHEKKLKVNNDGTYNISLDVTGDSITKVGKANVIVVFDVSYSMTESTGKEIVTYTETDSTGNGLYGFINGQYVPLTRQGSGSNRTFWYNGVQYTGQRYTRSVTNETRLDAARTAVNSLANSLLSNNGNGNPNDTVQMALITFAGVSKVSQTPTTSYSTFERAVNNTSVTRGTNWEDALKDVDNVNFGDNDPTYVIFVSDGNPTLHVTDGGYNDYNTTHSTPSKPVYGTGLGNEPNITYCYEEAKDDAKAIVDSGKKFYTIGAYGDVDRMKNLTTYSGAPESNYYEATDTDALNNALNSILREIEAAGIGSVVVSDGTTSSVKAKSGTVHLLKVDETSYKYWISMEVTEEGGHYINETVGSKITFTQSGNNYVGTWTDRAGSHSITGEIIEDPDDSSKHIFKMEWTSAGNDLHRNAPPAATLVTDSEGNDSVDWDLSSLGVLLNGVKYTVTFDAWPTQYTYDLIADLKNGKVSYSDLSSSDSNQSPYKGLDKYISKSLTGDYYLETNTEAVLSYKDTRIENAQTETSVYDNPPAVKTNVDTIDVIKEWENSYDSQQGNPIDIIVNRETNNNTEEFYRANLSIANNYTKNDINIATGLMRLKLNDGGTTGTIQVLDEGHDYSFAEESGQYYKWEFVAQTVHPMLINGELKELVLLDDAATQNYTNNPNPVGIYQIPTNMPSDADYYNDGTNSYVRLNGKLYVVTNAKPTIKAYNYRRSNLNLNKLVDGDSADPDELFEFKIKVNDPGLESNEKLWFSIYDENNQVIIDDNLPVSSNWTQEVLNGSKTGFYYGENNSTLTVSLKKGQNLRFTNLTTKATYEIIETDKQDFVFEDADGVADYGSNHDSITYTKGEDYEVDKANKKITGNITLTNSTFSISVKNTYQKAKIEITKKWDDKDNQDGKRPDSIQIQIYRQVGQNGTPESYGSPITIDKSSANSNDSNEWNYTIESDQNLELPRFDTNGNEYLYTVKELPVTDYTTEYSPRGVNQTDGLASYTITNKHTPENYNTDGELEVTKIWDDENNKDGLRKNVTIELYKNGSPTGQTITLSTQDNSKGKFTNLPKYENGQEIKYTIVETTTLQKYEAPVYDMNTPGKFKVTNKHTPEQYNTDGELEVTKIWDDANNQDGLRKDVTIELYKNGSPTGQTITLSTQDNSKGKFTNLPKYENGQEILYTIVETTTLQKYEAPVYDMSTQGKFKVTNKHTPENYNTDGELEVTKVWDDLNNQDGLRKNVTIELYKNGSPTGKTITLTTQDNSKGKFTNLPKYENGQEITYTIVETTTLQKYEAPVYDMNTPGKFKVTNKHTPEQYNTDGELEVTKIWDDSNNQDGLRKDVTIELYKNGSPTGKTITLTTQDNSSDKFTNLPKYENGVEIKYTIVETTTLQKYEAPVYDMNTPGKFKVTNKHTPENYNTDGELEVTKIWDDQNNKDGLRNNVTIELYKNGSPTGKTITLTTQDNSKGKFTNLPKYENGQEIRYTIVETTTLQEYEAPVYNTNTPGKFTVTNKHGVVPVSIDITKQWVDNANQDGKRPSTISVDLYGNGEYIRTETINGDVTKDTWTYTISNLDKYKDGQEIKYTIKEKAVDGYNSTVNGFTIINTHNPSKIKIEGKKTWVDEDNKYGRPGSITVVLNRKVGNTTLTPIRKTVTEADNWEYKFENLDEYQDGNIITYWISEDAVRDYTTEVNGYNITNTYTPETITIEGVKTWDDAGNQDGKRPGSITVNLKNGDEIVATQEVSGTGDQWSYKFENVIEYANGTKINYTIEEVGVDGTIYTATVNGYNITNKHTPETITYNITKNWDDYNNSDQIRPNSITVNLYKTVNGARTHKQTVTMDASNNWSYTFNDLPRYENGVEIVYDIEEDVVKGYATSYDVNDTIVGGRKEINNTITNTQTTEITVEKNWDDNNDSDHIRPDKINVNVYADGVYIKTIQITKDNNWKFTLDGLLKYDNGREIVYTIDEEDVDGYTKSINGFIITNKHEPTPPTEETPKKNDNVEEMPPKTGIEETDDYSLLVFISLIGTYKVLSRKIKYLFEQKKEYQN